MPASSSSLIHDDWGERSARWAGIRSTVVDLGGARVHVLRASAGAAAPPRAPTQVLVGAQGGSAASWLDLMPLLARHGPVVAPDLPGAGQTVPPHRRALRLEAQARYLCALLAALGGERVVLHGWSMGAVVVLRGAQLWPDRVERLVLVAPQLAPSGAPPGPVGRLVGRVGVRVVAAAGRVALAAVARPLRRRADPPRFDRLGADPARIAPETTALFVQDQAWRMARPWRRAALVEQWAAVTSAVYLDRRPLEATLAALTVPTLVLCGDRDPMCDHEAIGRFIATRPGWRLDVLDGIGHLPPVEAPQAYAEAVARWSTATGSHTAGRDERGAGGTRDAGVAP